MFPLNLFKVTTKDIRETFCVLPLSFFCFSLVVFCVNISEAYSEPSQTSKIELFAKVARC